jgi:hypothetical protein
VADIRRLRRYETKFTFGELAEHLRIVPKSPRAIALSKGIGRLRKAEQLPLPEDQLVEFWGNESCWAHFCAESLWLYYQVRSDADDEVVVLIAVHDHLHEM